MLHDFKSALVLSWDAAACHCIIPCSQRIRCCVYCSFQPSPTPTSTVLAFHAIISFAFLMVLASTALMVPVLLYVLGLTEASLTIVVPLKGHGPEGVSTAGAGAKVTLSFAYASTKRLSLYEGVLVLPARVLYRAPRP